MFKIIKSNSAPHDGEVLINNEWLITPDSQEGLGIANASSLKAIIPFIDIAKYYTALSMGVVAGHASLRFIPGHAGKIEVITQEPGELDLGASMVVGGRNSGILKEIIIESYIDRLGKDALKVFSHTSGFDFENNKLAEAVTVDILNAPFLSGYKTTPLGSTLHALEMHLHLKPYSLSDKDLVTLMQKNLLNEPETIDLVVELIKEAQLTGSDKVGVLTGLSGLTKQHEYFYKGEEHAGIYWHQERIGSTYRRSNNDFSVQFNNPLLQAKLANDSPFKRSLTPSVLAQLLPDATGDSRQIMARTIENGLHGMGNLTVQDPTLPQREIDRHGVSLDACAQDGVYDGLIFNVMRPSMVKKQDIKLAPFEHQQYKEDRDEVAVSGNQPKTVVHLVPGPHGVEIRQASIKESAPATHILKIPPSETGRRAVFGGREWLSMKLVQAMGVETPSFALVDLNNSARQYIAGVEGVQNVSGQLNLMTVDMKKTLFDGRSAFTEYESKVTLLTDDERNYGAIIEPPGFIIERFDIPQAHEEGVKVMGVEFNALAGKDSSQRFEGSYEEIAALLKEHSTDIQNDSEALFKRIASSWLIADGDFHMKNASMLLREENGKITCKLAPAYDVLSMAGLSGFSVDSALFLNNTKTPSIKDFYTYGAAHLDLSVEWMSNTLQEMGQAALKELAKVRGTPALNEPSEFVFPSAINKHRYTRTTMENMVNGVEMTLVTRGVLPDEEAQLITERIQKENPRVYQESMELHKEEGRTRHN